MHDRALEDFAMPDDQRFVQLVITKHPGDIFHITWQNEKSVVRGEQVGIVDAMPMVIDALSSIDVADPKRAY